MLRIIEEDADTFVQCAEMYYKKRPELISMVEEFYRAHRSLAEQYDRIKSATRFRLIKPWASPNLFRYQQEKTMIPSDNKSYDSYSESYDPLESGESDVDTDLELDEEKEEEHQIEKKTDEGVDSIQVDNDEVVKLRAELDKFKEENSIQKRLLMEKDEEKREAIRQLTLAMDDIREENLKLRRCIAKESPVKRSPIFGKLFKGSPKPSALISKFQ
ncbi:hypothetical protein NMG60_11013889 [Bertholletia excelsa]